MVDAESENQVANLGKEECLTLFKEISDNSKTVADLVNHIISLIKSENFSLNEGISLLDAKNHLMIFYLLNLVQVMVTKTTGKSIENLDIIERLVELRVILEKIRPLEKKLKYQIDKFVKISVNGSSNQDDPLHFRANLDKLINEEEESNDENDLESDKPKVKAYVPPKLSAVYYNADETRSTKRQKIIERARKHALQSSVMHELKEEYLDAPTEVKMTNSLKQREDLQQKRKRDYEEEYMTRLPVTKKEINLSKRLSTLSSLGDEVTRFVDTSVLQDDSSFVSINKRSKSKKTGHKRKTKRRKLH